MRRTCHAISCATALAVCAFLHPATAGAAYSPADLTGPWRSAALASGPGAPWWERANIDIAPGGNFTAIAFSNYGETDTLQSSLALDANGLVTLAASGTFLGALDVGRTVLVATDTWTGDEAGTTELRVALKTPGGATPAGLAGAWELNSLVSGPGAPWWMRGRLTVAADGSFTGDLTDHTGSTDPASGSLVATPDGAVTLSFAPQSLGWLDAGRTVLVLTNSWPDGTPGSSELAMLVKMAPAYVQADLAGTWEMHALATGPGAPWWNRAHVTVAADGTFSGTELESAGTSRPISGTLTLAPDGTVTRDGSASGRGVLDAGRSVLVWTETWTTGSPGTSELRVGVRTGGSTAGVEGSGRRALVLEPVRPNPARGGPLEVRFALDRAGAARLELLDVAGRAITVCEVGHLGPGAHTAALSPGGHVPPGLYFVRLRQGTDERVVRVTLLE